MKRFLSLLLIFCLVLSGCGILAERMREPVTFYYVRSGYDANMSQVIGSEERDAAGHRGELSYLLALYLMGPSQEGLRMPFPGSTRVLSVEREGGSITLELSDTGITLTDAQFSLACACLSLTCLNLTDAETVTILSAERSVTMSRDNLVLFDGSTPATAEETQ